MKLLVLYFLSSGLQRRGRHDNGFYGYLPNDISKQGRLFNDRICCYCNKNTANISCSNKDCQRTFHFICGINNGARNQFVAPNRSYCHRHVKVPKYRPKASEYCCICYEKLLGESSRFKPATMLRAPCCRHVWFHKLCLQTFAHSAGNSFRCPVCNNTNTFLNAMRYWGVFVHDNIEQPIIADNQWQQNEEEMLFHEIARIRFAEPIVEDNQRQQYEAERLYQDNQWQQYEEERLYQDNQWQQYEEERFYQGIIRGGYYHEELPRVYNERRRNDNVVYDYCYGNSYTSKYESKGLSGLSWIADNVLSHPFIVLRQQCQVNIVSRRFHLLPFSLVPIIIQLYCRQGHKTFWKGFGCSLICKGIAWILGKPIFSGETSIAGYIISKCIDAATLGLKRDCLISTVGSLLVPYISSTSHRRQISLKSLFFPYLCVEVAKDAFRSRVKSFTLAILRNNRISAPWENYENQKLEMRSDLISRIITEVAFYPMETVLHRLLLQDTGTIIDNLDNGKTVQPILTYFQGVKHCYSTIINMEGYTGFYKGFGALIMQFSVHTVILKLGMLLYT
ncbi:uncharacterized protein LOC105219514 isoform X3 [Zeugodacus cucurbitae]|uniref:uncharacterized protein LOC105219514 isoform X3 n=1 Tax=Zeugodacus cucurbitae TaxID=28588 RepID=UPI0023D950C3|nr:uncharacterized protein LOC105219514 isoform X3 [Zeugodacus cucurbitae]